jgi:hypothetical protein
MYSIFEIAGNAPTSDFLVPDSVQQQALGTMLTGVDPFWGMGEFIYLKSNDAIVKGSVLTWDQNNVATLVPNTANTGFPIAVAIPGAAAAGTFFWAQVGGLAVYKTNATVAANAAIGVAAAGILGTNTAGKQVLNCKNLISATGTATVTANTVLGSGVLVTNGYDGFFVGMALSGTGIPASTVVSRLNSDGRTIQMGSAIGLFDRTATASGTITLTGTYTGYGAGFLNRSFVQGAIT